MSTAISRDKAAIHCRQCNCQNKGRLRTPSPATQLHEVLCALPMGKLSKNFVVFDKVSDCNITRAFFFPLIFFSQDTQLHISLVRVHLGGFSILSYCMNDIQDRIKKKKHFTGGGDIFPEQIFFKILV